MNPKTDFASFDHWALTEEVELTLIERDDERIRSVFLVQRVGLRDQFVLTFEECEILVNGERVDLGETAMVWCGLADEIALAPNGGVVGRRVRCAAPPA
jgi:hypothetical protein